MGTAGIGTSERSKRSWVPLQGASERFPAPLNVQKSRSLPEQEPPGQVPPAHLTPRACRAARPLFSTCIIEIPQATPPGRLGTAVVLALLQISLQCKHDGHKRLEARPQYQPRQYRCTIFQAQDISASQRPRLRRPTRITVRSAWEQRKLGEVIANYAVHATPDEEVTVLTSSREGLQRQEDHFGRLQQCDTSDWNVIPRGFCTYRNRSDDGLFTFNVNKIADSGIVSKFYPVFETVDCNADFLTAYLNSNPTIKHKLSVLAVGTSQVVLSYGMLGQLDLLLPNRAEQEVIAAVLNSLDSLITLHQREVGTRGSHAQSLTNIQQDHTRQHPLNRRENRKTVGFNRRSTV